MSFIIHCLGIERPYKCGLKFKLDIFLVSDCSKTLFTHPTNVILFSSIGFLLDMVTYLTFLNVVLNGLKQNTFNGWRSCDVWDGKVIMFKPISCACDIVYKIT